jgi:hypothetical protein
VNTTSIVERTPEQQRRYDFFLHLTGWGELTADTTVALVCIEDGGPAWLQRAVKGGLVDRSYSEVDAEIAKHSVPAPACEVKGFRFIPDPTEDSPQKGATERTQVRTAWRLRKEYDRTFSEGCETYWRHYGRQYEVVGNLFPFAKPKADVDLSPRMKDFVGYAQHTSLDDIHNDVLPTRLDGLAQLAKILAQRKCGLMVFMGLLKYEEKIIRRLLNTYRRWDAGGEHRVFPGHHPYRQKRTIHCWQHSGNTPTLCFVDDATRRFTPAVCEKLIEYLASIGWPSK